MKAGVRALGIAESYRGDTSVLAGAVVTAERVVDGFAFTTCRVGGLDATDAVGTLLTELDREDVQYVFLSGIAPAWYNLFDLHTIHRESDRPVISVSFEASEGLEDGIREAFYGDALERRLQIYEAQPERTEFAVNDETVFVRSVGFEDEDDGPETVVDAFTPVGGRPEPLRVARLAARGVDEFRHREGTPAGGPAGPDADPGS